MRLRNHCRWLKKRTRNHRWYTASPLILGPRTYNKDGSPRPQTTLAFQNTSTLRTSPPQPHCSTPPPPPPPRHDLSPPCRPFYSTPPPLLSSSPPASSGGGSHGSTLPITTTTNQQTTNASASTPPAKSSDTSVQLSTSALVSHSSCLTTEGKAQRALACSSSFSPARATWPMFLAFLRMSLVAQRHGRETQRGTRIGAQRANTHALTGGISPSTRAGWSAAREHWYWTWWSLGSFGCIGI